MKKKLNQKPPLLRNVLKYIWHICMAVWLNREMKTTPHSGVYPHTCNTDATWCKLFKSTHQSKDSDQENACSQVTATTASPYNNRHSSCSCRSEKDTDWKVPQVWRGSAYPFRPIRSCLRLHVLKGLRITAKNKDTSYTKARRSAAEKKQNKTKQKINRQKERKKS